jgi:D-alanyl-D-alanine carboxypeptidase
VTEEEELHAFAGEVDALAASDQFSGAILVTRGTETVLEKVWGLADRDLKIPITIDSRFRVGSVGKMFTAVAALQLIEAGRLDLSESVSTYLPDYPNRDIASKVTIHHLFSHKGGTGDHLVAEFLPRRMEIRTHRDWLGLLNERSPEFEPGTKDIYSNYGYVLLAAIIEKVCGLDFNDFLETNLFARAGMTSTGSLPETVEVPHRVIGYTRKEDQWVSSIDLLPLRASGAGGGYSTVRDLLKFARALENGTLLPQPWLALATKPHSKLELHHYGYGFALEGVAPKEYYGHPGGQRGANAIFRIYPKSCSVLITLSNMDPPSAGVVARLYCSRVTHLSQEAR